MSWGEARHYIEGLNRRHRQGWEQTRQLWFVLVKGLFGQNGEFPLPWDNQTPKAESAEDSEEALEELRRRAEELEKKLNENEK